MITRLLLAFLIIPSGLYAQEGFITGKVSDSISHEPLAFVSIVYNSAGQGVVTNLEGNFRIPRSGDIRFLKLRYVGYHTKTITLNPGNIRSSISIQLRPDPMDIVEVVVYPTENPAHRIIKLASENRAKNNPEKNGPFSYISYDKMIFDVESDSSKGIVTDSLMQHIKLPDTLKYGIDQKGRIDLKRFLDKQYLFMMESVSSRKFLSPGKNKEEIIASKISGISQPSFMIMARQFQSFSFYENLITIADRQFLSPICTGSTDKYFFLIEDTTYTDYADTVFIISFRPMKGKTFEGLKGVLYINSNGYAVQNVIAEAYEQKNEIIKVSIQQQYELIDGKRWFPVLLSSTMRFNIAKMGYSDVPVTIIGTGKTYIVNINFNPVIKPSEFSDVQIEVKPDAHKQSEEVWATYRVDSLNAKEAETYRVIDSLGKAEHLDRTFTSFETILTGYMPGRYWNFDIRRFIGYNRYEGFRLGAGGQTTQQFSKKIVLGGYAAYGFKDKAFKYCGSITLNLIPKYELDMTLLYRDDVHESGSFRFNESWSLSGTAFIRDYMVKVMDKVRESEFSIGFRTFKYMTVRPYLTHSNAIPTNNYGFSLNTGNPQILLTRFDFTELGIKLRYAYKETFMKSPRGNKFSMGTKSPVLCFNVARGTELLNGSFTYWRTELKITKTFTTKTWGETHMSIISGLVSGKVPYAKLYAGLGSYRPFTLETEQSFGTMRFNEFLSDKFFGLFIKHDLGKLLFKPKGKFQPEIALVHNFGFGSLTNKEPHENIAFKTMNKGYFEGGLLINNLLRVQLFKYGVGVFYRYGPYAFTKTIDNFAFKLSLQLNL
jgi:hypothetical protein